MSDDATASSSTPFQRSQPCRHFELHEIQLATNNFDESRVIGRGGFGKVYVGTIYDGSTPVDAAIKRLDFRSSQGEPEFWAEVEMLSKLRHCNLVSLYGYCNHGREMILLYEYIPNRTLGDHLHKLQTPLSWLRRLKICIGAARGLHYLHTGTGIDSGVIHRDVKSSNILLDESWAAKISDFGLSRIAMTNQTSTGVSTLVKGTFGYFDPDYYSTGRLTRKSDVYAFGVVLLEVLCRKQAIDDSLGEDQPNLARWVQESIGKNKLKQIIDSDIRGEISLKCLKQFVRIVLRCLASNPRQRYTMAEVLVGLDSILTLSERLHISLEPAGRSIFGRMIDKISFPATGVSVPATGDNTAESETMDIGPAESETMDIRTAESLEYDFELINAATNHFSMNNKIGEFGSVYKGKLQDGQEVAVKKMSVETGQDVIEFRNVVMFLAELQHHNLVRLLGFSLHNTERLLIYEFMRNSSLDRYIFDPTMHLFLDWERRYNVIKGIARGLLYLHRDIGIIHSCLKARSILLDEKMDPKIVDFGLTLLFDPEEIDGEIPHTSGYMAPESQREGIFSMKSDVFSFGVLVLEIITGRKNRSREGMENLVSYAWRSWEDGSVSDMVDPTLMVGPGSLPEIVRSTHHIGLLCVQEEAVERPTMTSVLSMLYGFSDPLPVPSKPAFRFRS